MRQLSAFAAEGLRTLLVAERELSQDDLDEWLPRYRAAQTAISGRDAAMEAAAEEIEQGLELVGATAIEDRLQDGVPEAIESLAAAGCKIWMLTGDKARRTFSEHSSRTLEHWNAQLHVTQLWHGIRYLTVA